jgi:hypothetical protein
MIYMDIGLNKNVLKFIPGFLSMIAIFTPHGLNQTIFRTARAPLEIHANQSVPPKSAFESLKKAMTVFEKEWEEVEIKKAIDLNSTLNDRPDWNPIAEINHNRISIPEMHISAREMRTNNEAMASNEYVPVEEGRDLSWVQGLTEEQRDRLLEAQNKSQVLEKNWTIPNWQEAAKEKIEAIHSSVKNVAQKASNPNIHISGTGSKGEIVYAKNRQDEVGILLNDKITNNLHKIKGTLALAPGLALGDRTLELHRYLEGVAHESGRVNVQTGEFEILTQDDHGSLIAELFDKSGLIVASGSINIEEQNKDENKDAQLEILVSQKNQFAGNLVNFNRSPDRLITSKMNSFKGEAAEILYSSLGVSDKTDVLGTFRFPKVASSSWGIVRAQAKKFRESIFLMGAGEGQNLAMIPESLITALENLTDEEASKNNSRNESQKENHGGVIWGQILLDGKPVSGITVSMELNEDMAPIYLEGFIPNKSIPATTENGFFVFTDLMPGYYSLVARRNGEYFGHINLVSDENTVAVGNIEASTRKRTSSLKVYDAFEGSPEEAQVQLQSLKEDIFVPGIANIQLPKVQRLSLGQVQPARAEYAPTRINYNDSDDYIHVPLVRLEWLDYISQQGRISQSPNTGVVVGFVPEDSFEAYLTHEDKYSTDNIIYFDHKGVRTQTGVAGGGFVMFNVPVGTQSVVVMSKKSEMLSSIVVPVDEKSISTSKFHF